jgi:hypothetical protein
MPQWLASLIAALIGASVGSIGAVLASGVLKRRAEFSERREALVQRYLYQLQDSAESLWYRLHNLLEEDGRTLMEDEYFETTTLYALGRVLAIERSLALEGVYPQLERLYPALGSFLREHRVDHALPESFFQYDRLALAEAIMERDGDRYRPSTYLEFRRRYERDDPGERKWLAPAREAIEFLDKTTTGELLDELSGIARAISQKTRIGSTVPESSDDNEEARESGVS